MDRLPTSLEGQIGVSLLAACAGYSFFWYATQKKTTDITNAPPVPTKTADAAEKKKECVLVLGAGTIGASFSSVFLAQGMEVVCVDPRVPRETLEKRIREYWPNLVARGLTEAKEPPFGSLTRAESLEGALTKPISFVQECTWEDVDHKQNFLAELDSLLDPSILLASSTSFITWPLLTSKCQHKHRIMIGHPAIPHTHSYMEIYGVVPEWVQHCKEWYANSGFDVVVMKKTIPGHVFNSFLRVNIDHGTSLVRKGVCSVEDVNKAMRHWGRDMYARHTFVSLLVGIGGDRGVEGGKELAQRIRKDAVFLIFYSALMEKNWPDVLARPLSRHLGAFVEKNLLPQAPEEYLRAAEMLEEALTNGGEIPVTTALFNKGKNVYDIIPLEVDKDPFPPRLPGQETPKL